MKKLLIATMILGIQSCGKTDFIRETLRNNVDTDSNNNSQVADINKKDLDQDSRLNDLETRISSLESSYALNVVKMSQVESSIESNQVTLQALQTSIDSLYDSHEVNHEAIESLETLVSSHEAALISLQDDQASSQASINVMMGQIATLNGHDSIIEMVDPCGDKANTFDEVLLRTKSGKLIAYFEQGNNRFLSVLTPGHFRTTDSQACNFSVDAQNNVTW